MDNKVTVFTVIPPMYRLYPEFQLCLRMFKENLPAGTVFVAKEGGSESLKELLDEHSRIDSEFVLILKEPAVLMKKGTVEELLRVLQSDEGTLCVLPSDTRGFREGRHGCYFTVGGLENFTEALYEPEVSRGPYDGRSAWMFLVRRDILSSYGISGEPLEIPSRLPPEKVCIALNAYIHPFIDYDLTTSRKEVLPLIPEGIGSLLDIGCHTGNFGALAKEKFGCRVVGSEVNPQAAEVARKKLDDVIGDVLAAKMGERFDCVTCLDVIEHFVDTEAFLRKAWELLNPEGYLLLSVPNVGHWSVLEDLMAGRWDYQPAGTLCVSHVRFFTRRSIEAVLGASGFGIVSILEQTTEVPQRITDLIDFMERSRTAADRTSLSSLGYYILARKKG